MEIKSICSHKYILSNVELPVSIYRKISKKNLLSFGRGPNEGALKRTFFFPIPDQKYKKKLKKTELVPDLLNLFLLMRNRIPCGRENRSLSTPR